MPRHLILGTAGHIDHGKTALVKALTGTDTDRLPEEKARGITVDIGFARLDLGDAVLGVIDVPGHERFVRNMLAGAAGIDLALLVVAADDSVMPQTREHLDILKLLGVRRGVVALTKCDLVDATTREVAELEVREVVKGSFLADAEIVPVSVVTGTGVDDLKAALRAACEVNGERRVAEPFRLPIDRAFVLQGHGTVVTGSIIGGSVRVGDELEWHRGDGATELVRVRSLSTHGKSASELHRGQRAGLNLAGVPVDAVHRGQELATPGALTASKILTVRLTALPDTVRGLKHRLPCRLHTGTAEVMATISLLEGDRLEPGQSALAQLFADEPVTAAWGQPFVLRDSSAEHTLGGGVILQADAVKVRRRDGETLKWLRQLSMQDAAIRAEAVAWLRGYAGIRANDLIRGAGVKPDEAEPLLRSLAAAGMLVGLPLPNRTLVLHAERLAELAERLLATLAELHAANPLMTNHPRAGVLAHVAYVGDEPLLQAVTDLLLSDKKVVGDALRIARADFRPKLTANQRKLKDRIVEEHRAAGFQPPDVSAFANHAGGNTVALTDIFEVACAEGFLVRLADGVYLHADAHAKMLQLLHERLSSGVGMTVGEVRELLGTTRKFAVPICVHLDRTGVTVRRGDLRVLAKPSV